MSDPRPTPPLSDAGNAERFAAVNSWRLRFVHGLNRWRCWDGRRWSLDETNEAMRLALVSVRGLYGEAAEAPKCYRSSSLTAGSPISREQRDGEWPVRAVTATA